MLFLNLHLTATARAQQPTRPAFDADQAWAHLLRQVEFGPRVPNRPGHAACRTYLLDTLRPLADAVATQDFSRRLGGRRLQMSNVVARWRAADPALPFRRGVLLCAHWDTRPTADYESTRARRKLPIPGANDGASGVAVLLELARIFNETPPPVPVMMVFFDGEDYGPGLNRMFLGARHFAAHLPKDVPRRGVLLDMIGDRSLSIPQEQNSRRHAPEVLREVYAVAARLGYQSQFPTVRGPNIQDDHLPLIKRGLKVIDLIDFSYGPGHSWWHTLADTPDKCSATSLGVVGNVMAEWVYGQ